MHTIALPGSLVPEHWLTSPEIKSALNASPIIEWLKQQDCRPNDTPDPTIKTALITPCTPQQSWLAAQIAVVEPINILGALAELDLPSSSQFAQTWRIEPVHFRLATDHIVLAQAGFSDLALADARSLIQALAPLAEHFKLSITVAPSGRWYLNWDASGLSTSTSHAARGRNIDIYLPRNSISSFQSSEANRVDSARLWRRIATEIEMTWFNHPVNDARQNAGQLPVNSLWLESACSRGTRPAGKSHALSDDPEHADLFASVGLALVDSFDATHPSIIENNSLNFARIEANAWDWLQAWQALEQPLLAQLQAAQASAHGLELICFGEVQQKSWQIKPKNMWQRFSNTGRSFGLDNLSEVAK